MNMKAEQISIFLENKAGRLTEVTQALQDAHVNIRALSLADTSDFGILRLIVSDLERAKKILQDRGFTLGCTSVVAVEVDDQPGGLNRILAILSHNGINIEYMYAFVNKDEPKATMIFRFDNIDKAIDVLLAENIHIVAKEQLAQC